MCSTWCEVVPICLLFFSLKLQKILGIHGLLWIPMSVLAHGATQDYMEFLNILYMHPEQAL